MALSANLSPLRVVDQFMYESGGGKWNHLGINTTPVPQVELSLGWNQYWGDERTRFGSLDTDSSVSFSLTYTF